MVNDFININKTNNHLSLHPTEHKKDHDMQSTGGLDLNTIWQRIKLLPLRKIFNFSTMRFNEI
jgi:ribosomal protein S15P/S13E